MKFQLTDRRSLYIGVLISIVLISTPFLFYLYRITPDDSKVWETPFFTLNSGGFNTVQGFVYMLFTKAVLVLITSLWFLTTEKWWRYAILVPFVMFLFQLSGVLNQQIEYIDNYDFWYSLPLTIPVLLLHIIAANKLKFFTQKFDARAIAEAKIESLLEE